VTYVPSTLQAPGYSAAIKRPMDFTTMRRRHAEGVYTTWDGLQEDMRTMFNNAMNFNPPETLYHKQVDSQSRSCTGQKLAAPASSSVSHQLAQHHLCIAA
jgi:Bromodomain